MEPVSENVCRRGLLVSQDFKLEYNSPSDDLKSLEDQLTKEGEMITRALIDLSKTNGMQIIQENGQRKYGPPFGYTGDSEPAIGSEVFIGGLPRDCYEVEIVPIFERMGPIFQLRLMMNFSGNNRGYGFVKYFNPADAEKAVRYLNGFEIRKEWRIGVTKSIEKRTLFIDNILKDKDEQEILIEIQKSSDGIIKLDAPKSYSNNRNEKNKGFAFAEFQNHKLALDFLNKTYYLNVRMWGNRIKAKWAEPTCLSRSITISNLSPETSAADLEIMFNNITNNGVLRVEKIISCAIIFFQTRHRAKMAKTLMQDKLIDGIPVKIQMNSLPENNYIQQEDMNTSNLSIPARLPEDENIRANIETTMQQQPSIEPNFNPQGWNNNSSLHFQNQVPFMTHVCENCGFKNTLTPVNFAFPIPYGTNYQFPQQHSS